MYTVHHPLTIGSRLLPCLDLGSGHRIHLRFADAPTEGGRYRWRAIIEADGQVISDDEGLSTPMLISRETMIRDAFVSLIGFLEAAAESYEHNGLRMVAGTNTDLFPEDVVVWAHGVLDELASAAIDLDDLDVPL